MRDGWEVIKLYIAIAGNLGSGKTTFARMLAESLNFKYIPQEREELEYLNNFFKDVPKYFLTTQLTFLINKAYQIEKHLKENNSIVLDRTLYEDISIFAEYWIDNSKVIKREKDVYNRISHYLINTSPAPDVIIYISSSIATSKKRIDSRGKREFEKDFPKDYVEELHERYSSLIANLISKEQSIILSLDSDMYDFTKSNIQQEIIDELIFTIRNPNDSNLDQISLWDDIDIMEKSDFVNRKLMTLSSPEFQQGYHVDRYLPVVYIAAPFTAYATEEREINDELKIDSGSVGYGVIPKAYQRRLLRIELKLRQLLVVSTFLPHRDINDWGKKELPSSEVLKNLITYVEESDIIVAIPADSFGVHMELSLALARNIPMVVFEVEELNNSFFVSSFKNATNCLYLKVTKLSQVSRKLASSEVIEFLRDYVEVRS